MAEKLGPSRMSDGCVSTWDVTTMEDRSEVFYKVKSTYVMIQQF